MSSAQVPAGGAGLLPLPPVPNPWDGMSAPEIAAAMVSGTASFQDMRETMTQVFAPRNITPDIRQQAFSLAGDVAGEPILAKLTRADTIAGWLATGILPQS